ncbi:hypothetical protein ARSEF1564_006667 [Beauveria bassiana]
MAILKRLEPATSNETNYCYLENIADPDITGWGVVASFVASVTLTIFTIAWVYARGKLPAHRYNSVDVQFLSTFFWRSHLVIRRRLSSSTETPPRAPPDPSAHPRLSRQNAAVRREKKLKAYERLILAVSDQQLITGFALLVSTNVICASKELSRTWSVYSYQIATSSAFFAALTHLSCVTVLRDYFLVHKALRGLRFGSMGVILIILIANLAIGQSDIKDADKSRSSADDIGRPQDRLLSQPPDQTTNIELSDGVQQPEQNDSERLMLQTHTLSRGTEVLHPVDSTTRILELQYSRIVR